MNDYDKLVKAIRVHNKPILDAFEDWLKAAGLSDKTIQSHVSNIDFFAHYLVYYEPLEKLDEAGASDVHMFLAYWFPRKAMWASPSSQKSNMASFRKFFKFMVESNRMSGDSLEEVRRVLKESKDEFMGAVEFDDIF